MADSVRIVTFGAGGQITELGVLQDSLGFEINNSGFSRDTLSILRGDRNQKMIQRGDRYGGEYFGGERLSNASYKFQIMLYGASTDAMLTKLAEFLVLTERTPGDHYIEHKADGVTYPSYYEIRAPAKVQEVQSWSEQFGTGVIRVDVDWPVAPLACGAPMDIDSTFPGWNGPSADDLECWTVYGWHGSGSAGQKNIYEVRGYTLHRWTSMEIITQMYGAMNGYLPVGGWFGVVGRWVSENTYLEVYIDDNGTSTRLRIDTVVGGTRVNRASVNLPSRQGAGSQCAVRLRMQSSPFTGVLSVTADAFTSWPTPMATPVATTTWSGAVSGLTDQGGWKAGTSCLAIGSGAGKDTSLNNCPGRTVVRPYIEASYGNAASDDGRQAQEVALAGLPGSAPARCDVEIGLVPTSGQMPAFCAISSHNRSEEATGGRLARSTTSSASANFTGASTSSFAGTEWAEWDFKSTLETTFDPLASGRFESWDVWAVVTLSSSCVGAALAVGYLSNGALTPIFSSEFGSRGVKIKPPSSGSATRLVRLGRVAVERPIQGSGVIHVNAMAVGAVGGSLQVNRLLMMASESFVSSPTAKSASGYPTFASGSGEILRTIREDLSGLASSGMSGGGVAAGLSGTGLVVQPVTGEYPALSLCLYAGIPNQIDTNTDSPGGLAFPYVHAAIVPRYHYQRDD